MTPTGVPRTPEDSKDWTIPSADVDTDPLKMVLKTPSAFTQHTSLKSVEDILLLYFPCPAPKFSRRHVNYEHPRDIGAVDVSFAAVPVMS